MKLRIKLLILGLVVLLVFPCTAMAAEDTSGPAPAQVETVGSEEKEAKVYETQDGVLEITAPSDNDKWSVIQDDSHWFTMSDGTDIITADHYANGDNIAAPVFADDTYVKIYQTYYSTENEIFVITGKVTVADDMPYVKDSVNSFRVLKYDTKKKNDTPAPVYALQAIGTTMYCTAEDGVQVRTDCSTDSGVLGGVAFGEAVYVNGEMTKDGVSTGWYQIQYGNGVAYVWKDWFDVNQPAADPVRTGDAMTIYSADGSMTNVIYFYTDGSWRDDAGIIYVGDKSGVVNGSDGSVWYEAPPEPDPEPEPEPEPTPTGDVMTIYSADGSMTKEIYFYTDGTWRDDAGIAYSGSRSAEVDGSDGSVWYESPME